MPSSEKSKPLFPYRGVRRSWYVYHPAYHGPSYNEGVWDEAAKRFHKDLGGFIDAAELYSDQQKHHETVGGDVWKREVQKLFNAIEKERNVYQLEALAAVIFDRDDKCTQRTLPYHSEVRKLSDEMRAEDLNLSLDGGLVNPKSIVRRGWAG